MIKNHDSRTFTLLVDRKVRLDLNRFVADFTVRQCSGRSTR